MATSFREKGALEWVEAGGSQRATGERTSDDASTGDNSQALRVGPSGLLDEGDAAQARVDPRHSARPLSQRAARVRTPPQSLVPFVAQAGGVPETCAGGVRPSHRFLLHRWLREPPVRLSAAWQLDLRIVYRFLGFRPFRSHFRPRFNHLRSV